jgi:hypothetical protein
MNSLPARAAKPSFSCTFATSMSYFLPYPDAMPICALLLSRPDEVVYCEKREFIYW